MVMSRFLPDNFDASPPLALIAGQGDIPCLTRRTSQTGGYLCSVDRIGRRNLPKLVRSFSEMNDLRSKVGQVGKLLKELKEIRCRICGDGRTGHSR